MPLKTDEGCGLMATNLRRSSRNTNSPGNKSVAQSAPAAPLGAKAGKRMREQNEDEDEDNISIKLAKAPKFNGDSGKQGKQKSQKSGSTTKVKKNQGGGKKKDTASKAVMSAGNFPYLVVHANLDIPASPTNMDYIFFYSHGASKGGPVAFLSNSYLSNFRDPQLHKSHVFNCAEQYYQFARLQCLTVEDERHNDWEPDPISSKIAYHVICDLMNPTQQTKLGRSFQVLADSDSRWGAAWQRARSACLVSVLTCAVKLKFKHNKDLRGLLVSTVHHMLIEASPYDGSCGIGFYADRALDNVEKRGTNLLGRILMDVRTYYQKQLEGESHEWKFDLVLDEQDVVLRQKHEESMLKTEEKEQGHEQGRGHKRRSRVLPPKSGKSNDFMDANADGGTYQEERSITKAEYRKTRNLKVQVADIGSTTTRAKLTSSLLQNKGGGRDSF